MACLTLPSVPCSLFLLELSELVEGTVLFQSSCSVLLLQLTQLLQRLQGCRDIASISCSHSARIPVSCSYLQNKAAHNSPSLSVPAECRFPFTLCKPQVFILKSCKKCKELGYQKSFRPNLLVLISFLNICVMLLHTMFGPNFTFESALFYITQLIKMCVFSSSPHIITAHLESEHLPVVMKITDCTAL